MSPETEQFEAELQRLRPAKAPEELLASVSRPPQVGLPQPTSKPRRGPGLGTWWRRLQWLAPAAAAIILAAVLIARLQTRDHPNAGRLYRAAPKPVIKADQVEFDRQLLAAFDAVARLPGGEPVRFRCRQWMDEVVLRDTATGVIIEQQTPRLEVVPIKFETY